MILAKLDGSFVVGLPDNPYHVVSRAIDPYNKYNIEEIAAYANDHPEEVITEDSAEETKAARRIEITARLKELDAEINYVQEDIIKALGLHLHPSKQAIFDEKAALRVELMNLEA